MPILRWRLIQLADAIDVYVLRHRVYRYCLWCAESSWWEEGHRRPGATCPIDWDRYRDV